MKQLRKIRFILLLLPVLTGLLAVLTVTSVTAQVTTVYPGETIDLAIEEEPAGSTYKWDVYCDLTVNFAQVDGACPAGTYSFTGGIDNQAAVQLVFNTPGEYMIKIEVWDPVMCTNNMKFIRLDVEESLPEAELNLDPDEICVDEPSVLTVTLTIGEVPWYFIIHGFDEDDNLIDIIESPEEGITTNSHDVTVMPTKTTIYRLVEIRDKNGEQIYKEGDPEAPEGVTLTVHPLPNQSRIYLKE